VTDSTTLIRGAPRGSPGDTGTQQPLRGGLITDETRGETAELLRLIDPAIETARRKLFGTPRAPFASWARARNWLNAASSRGTTVGIARGRRVYERARRACAALATLTGRNRNLEPPVLSYRPVPLPPDGPGRRLKVVWFAPGSKLAHIKRVVAAVAEGSGLWEEEVLAYLLTGNEPFLSPYSARIWYRKLPNGPARPAIEFQLNVQDVPWKEFRELYGIYRVAMRGRRLPLRLSSREARLKSTLQALGGTPQRSGAAAAWESISQRTGYPNGQAARVAYGRIQKKQARSRS
jgi:hypothetical protein